MNAAIQSAIEQWVSEATGKPFLVEDMEASRGGCIHQSGICRGGGRSYFFKLNSEDCREMFEVEAEGLKELAKPAAIRVPGVVAHGVAEGQACLVLEALKLAGPASNAAWQKMGKSLATLHRQAAKTHGWHRDNHIGSTPQSNRQHEEWADFYIEERLKPQFELARGRGVVYAEQMAVLQKVGELLAGHRPQPSLLHGDLWSGNVAFTEKGEPVFYDPATYYGDRETDIAFSEFFGGFPPVFYEAYDREYPLWEGYHQRKPVYNLYHVLNHANLFGGSYAERAEDLMGEILRA